MIGLAIYGSQRRIPPNTPSINRVVWLVCQWRRALEHCGWGQPPKSTADLFIWRCRVVGKATVLIAEERRPHNTAWTGRWLACGENYPTDRSWGARLLHLVSVVGEPRTPVPLPAAPPLRSLGWSVEYWQFGLAFAHARRGRWGGPGSYMLPITNSWEHLPWSVARVRSSCIRCPRVLVLSKVLLPKFLLWCFLLLQVAVVVVGWVLVVHLLMLVELELGWVIIVEILAAAEVVVVGSRWANERWI